MSVGENSWQPNVASRYLQPLEEYEDAVKRRFPMLTRRMVEATSVSPADALALGYFLEHCPHKVAVLNAGTVIGSSALFFASHPNVSRVVGVDSDPEFLDWVATCPGLQNERADLGSLDGVRTLDVVRAALAEFGNERAKIGFVERSAGDARAGIPHVDIADGTGLVAFVSGLRTRDDARTRIHEVFEQNPTAVVFLDDCRHARGPFVQAGVVDFVEQAAGEFHFRLVGDLGTGLASSNLGLLYPGSRVADTEEILAAVGRMFSERLDPLRLLDREEELIETVNRTNRELGQARRNGNRLQERNTKLKKDKDRLERHNKSLEQENAKLTTHYASRRYKLADTIAGGALRIPGLTGMLRRDGRSHDR